MPFEMDPSYFPVESLEKSKKVGEFGKKRVCQGGF
jgi:hypothetical protein